MVISIQIQTIDDWQLIEPVLKMLRQSNATFEVLPARRRLDKTRRAGIRRAIQFARSDRRKAVSKIEIPSRDDRNAR